LTTANLLLVTIGAVSTACILGFDCLEKRQANEPASPTGAKNRSPMPVVFRPQRLIRHSRMAIDAVIRSI
jgi:hypothetical protein